MIAGVYGGGIALPVTMTKASAPSEIAATVQCQRLRRMGIRDIAGCVCMTRILRLLHRGLAVDHPIAGVGSFCERWPVAFSDERDQ